MDFETYFNIEKECKSFDIIVADYASKTFYERNLLLAYDKVWKKMKLKLSLLKDFASFDKIFHFLPQKYQQVLTLKYKDKKNVDEIAKEMAISPRTVARYVEDAKKMIDGDDDD